MMQQYMKELEQVTTFSIKLLLISLFNYRFDMLIIYIHIIYNDAQYCLIDFYNLSVFI